MIRLIDLTPALFVALAWWRLRGVTGRWLALAGVLEGAAMAGFFSLVVWRLW